MRICFASGCAPHPFLRGGAEHTVHTLAGWLVRRGHEVRLLGSVDNFLFTHGRTLEAVAERLAEQRIRFLWESRASDLEQPNTARETVVTRHVVRYDVGYPVTLVEREVHVVEVLRETFAADRPDVVVTQLNQSHRVAESALASGIPTVLIQPSLEMGSTHPDSLEALSVLGSRLNAIVAPSQFIAETLRHTFELPSRVVHPAIDESVFWRAADPEEIRLRPWITLVNPQPKKGLNLFLRLAEALPEERFLTVETWFASPWTIRRLIACFPNVELAPILFEPSGMAEIYGRTRILVVPSAFDEAFGRVIVEAQLGGVPVVAVDRGGVAEALGTGGVLLPPGSPLEAWTGALGRLSGDPAYFCDLSKRARANAERFRIDVLGERFEEILEEVRERCL